MSGSGARFGLSPLCFRSRSESREQRGLVVGARIAPSIEMGHGHVAKRRGKAGTGDRARLLR